MVRAAKVASVVPTWRSGGLGNEGGEGAWWLYVYTWLGVFNQEYRTNTIRNPATEPPPPPPPDSPNWSKNGCNGVTPPCVHLGRQHSEIAVEACCIGTGVQPAHAGLRLAEVTAAVTAFLSVLGLLPEKRRNWPRHRIASTNQHQYAPISSNKRPIKENLAGTKGREAEGRASRGSQGT